MLKRLLCGVGLHLWVLADPEDLGRARFCPRCQQSQKLFRFYDTKRGDARDVWMDAGHEVFKTAAWTTAIAAMEELKQLKENNHVNKEG